MTTGILTMPDEVPKSHPHPNERQISRTEKDSCGQACHRTGHPPQHRKVIEAWADYLEKAKEKTEKD